MKRRFLSKSDIKDLNSKISGFEFSKKDKVEIVEDKYYVKDKECLFFIQGGKVVPSLKLLLKEDILPEVVVDMGAVKFIVGGADIMRPGIVEMSEFEEGDLVVVKDVNNKKPLVVGIAAISSLEMKETKEGAVIKNVHCFGDEVWNIN